MAQLDYDEGFDLGDHLEKTGAREIGILMLLALLAWLLVLAIFVPHELVGNYEGITIALITNVFLFNLGAFALKTHSNIQEHRSRVIAARNPRLAPDRDDFQGAG